MTKGFDGEAFGNFIVGEVNASIERSIAPILKRLEELEASVTKHGETERSVDTLRRSVDALGDRVPADVNTLIDQAVSKAVAAIPTPADGKSVTVDDIKPLLSDLVKEAVSVIPTPTDGKDGKDAEPVDMEAVKSLIIEECKDVRASLESTIGPEMQQALSVMVAEAVKAIPTPADGKDADPINMDEVKSLIGDAVKEAVSAIPTPADGRDGKDAEPINMDEVKSLIGDAVKDAVASIPVPKDGRDGIDGKDAEPVDMEAVKSLIGDAVAAIPVPKDGRDGKSVTVDDVKPLIDDVVSKAVAAIPVPKDGRDGADVTAAMIDRDGQLHLTLSNGDQKNVGTVVGRDGADCDFESVRKRIDEQLASWPKPKDGLGFDDLSVEYDGERTVKFVMSRGGDKKEFAFNMPVILDRGVFTEGKSYDKGDSVTWDGAIWIAQTDDATKKPGEGNNEWRLAVKRGKAGKNGVVVTPRENKPVKLGV